MYQNYPLALKRVLTWRHNGGQTITMAINIHLCKHLYTLMCVNVSSWTSSFVVQVHDDCVRSWCVWLAWMSRGLLHKTFYRRKNSGYFNQIFLPRWVFSPVKVLCNGPQVSLHNQMTLSGLSSIMADCGNTLLSHNRSLNPSHVLFSSWHIWHCVLSADQHISLHT